MPGIWPNEPSSPVAEVLFQRVADHAVGKIERVEGAGIERGLDDARAALVDIARDHENLAAGRGQRADFGRVVGLAVFMGGVDGDRAAGASKAAGSCRPDPCRSRCWCRSRRLSLMPRSIRMSAITSPWRASDGAVRKNRPLSSTVDRPGEVAEGEIITMPFGIATFCRIAPVTPEHIAADDALDAIRGDQAFGGGGGGRRRRCRSCRRAPGVTVRRPGAGPLS